MRLVTGTYVYAANGPTNFTDPNGQEIYDVPTGTQPNPGSIAGYGGASDPLAPQGVGDLSHLNPTDRELDEFDEDDVEIPTRTPTIVKVTVIKSMWDNYDEAVASGLLPEPGLCEQIGVGLGKTLLIRSAPSYLVEYSDGTKTLFMGAPSTGDMLNQALALLSITGEAATAKNVAQAMRAVAKNLGEEIVETGIDQATGLPIIRVGPKGADAPTTAKKVNSAPEVARSGDCIHNLTPEQIAKFPGCFAPGTLISTARGLRPIESIRPGDEVWAFDFSSATWNLRRVLESYRVDHTDDLIAVTVNGEGIDSTYHHPYWVVEGEELADRPRAEHIPGDPLNAAVSGRWVDAGDLRVGDVLLLKPNVQSQVTSVTSRPYNGVVHNFQVDDLHCYAVGPSQVLVHNNSKAATALPDANPVWGKNRFTKELHDRGFQYDGPTRSDNGLMYRNPQTGEEVRIMPKPDRRPFRNEPSEKFDNDWYYRYRSGPDQPWGPHNSLGQS